MTEYYNEVGVALDLIESEPDSVPAHGLSMILTDRDDRRAPPVAISLRPGEARELAFCLLEVAEHAERVRACR